MEYSGSKYIIKEISKTGPYFNPWDNPDIPRTTETVFEAYVVFNKHVTWLVGVARLERTTTMTHGDFSRCLSEISPRVPITLSTASSSRVLPQDGTPKWTYADGYYRPYHPIPDDLYEGAQDDTGIDGPVYEVITFSTENVGYPSNEFPTGKHIHIKTTEKAFMLYENTGKRPIAFATDAELQATNHGSGGNGGTGGNGGQGEYKQGNETITTETERSGGIGGVGGVGGGGSPGGDGITYLDGVDPGVLNVPFRGLTRAAATTSGPKSGTGGTGGTGGNGGNGGNGGDGATLSNPTGRNRVFNANASTVGSNGTVPNSENGDGIAGSKGATGTWYNNVEIVLNGMVGPGEGYQPPYGPGNKGTVGTGGAASPAVDAIVSEMTDYTYDEKP